MYEGLQSGFPILSSDSLLSLRRKSQWVCLTTVSSGVGGLPIFGAEGPEIGAEGAVLVRYQNTFFPYYKSHYDLVF